MYSKGFTLIELLVAITVVALISGGALIYLNNFNSKQKLNNSKETMVSYLKLAQSYAKTRQAPIGYTGTELRYVQVMMSGNNLTAGINGIGTTYFSNPINNGEVTVSFDPAIVYFWAGGILSHDNEGTFYGVGESVAAIVKSNTEDGGSYQIVINALGQISGSQYTK